MRIACSAIVGVYTAISTGTYALGAILGSDFVIVFLAQTVGAT